VARLSVTVTQVLRVMHKSPPQKLGPAPHQRNTRMEALLLRGGPKDDAPSAADVTTFAPPNMSMEDVLDCMEMSLSLKDMMDNRTVSLDDPDVRQAVECAKKFNQLVRKLRADVEHPRH
jgi:hypothetical protein